MLEKTIAATMLLAACATACASQPQYVRVAEGLSSQTGSERIQVAPRMFTAPQLVDACRAAIPIARLEVGPRELELTQGDAYALNSLTVVARDAAELTVPGVPIVLEVEDLSRPVLQLRSDDPDLNDGRLRGLVPGRLRMRVRSVCGARPAEAFVQVRVTR